MDAKHAMVLVTVLAVLARIASGDVFNMPSGQTALQFVTVRNAGNPEDTRYSDSIRGEVDYAYRVGKFEITAGQYCEFLNAVAQYEVPNSQNTLALYQASMWTATDGCRIRQTATIPGYMYSYSVAPDYANRPVNFVSWASAARFCNWLTNGQPTAREGAANTTEDGSYALNGHMDDAYLLTVAREADAKYALPSVDEWYKAAYYDPDRPGGAGYWDYPTRSDAAPGRDTTETTNPGNNANYYKPLPYPIDSGAYYTTVVGQFSLSASPCGTFDQGGNLAEFTEGIVDTYRVSLGGDFFDPALMMRASWNGISSGDTGGFRIVEVPEPATISLLFGVALPLLRRR